MELFNINVCFIELIINQWDVTVHYKCTNGIYFVKDTI